MSEAVQDVFPKGGATRAQCVEWCVAAVIAVRPNFYVGEESPRGVADRIIPPLARVKRRVELHKIASDGEPLDWFVEYHEPVFQLIDNSNGALLEEAANAVSIAMAWPAGQRDAAHGKLMDLRAHPYEAPDGR